MILIKTLLLLLSATTVAVNGQWFFGMVADMDGVQVVKGSGVHTSHFTVGILYPNYTIEFPSTITDIHASYAYRNRGFELSELIKFDGHTLMFDDKTGIVHTFDYNAKRVGVWNILGSPNNSPLPFKSEWACLYGAGNTTMLVGSVGHAYVDDNNKVSTI